MKVAILAGGMGTRLSEETVYKPKPLVEIGGKPILWHIMRNYSHFGFNEFVIAVGYKKECITSWMHEYYASNKNVTVKTERNAVVFDDTQSKGGWTVHLVDTGPKTLTGGRIKRLAPFLDNQTFMLTWCDAVADINLDALVDFHKRHGQLATVTAVRPPPRFGRLVLDADRVSKFEEKPKDGEYWINGAFFVLQPEVLNYIEDDKTQWEKGPLERLATEGQLMAYRHKGFWQCMDTIHEKKTLEELWTSGKAPWKTWRE
jgi:glucose-1-phosphate cytidylyltransferase